MELQHRLTANEDAPLVELHDILRMSIGRNSSTADLAPGHIFNTKTLAHCRLLQHVAAARAVTAAGTSFVPLLLYRQLHTSAQWHVVAEP
jgi:hypothetical protein